MIREPLPLPRSTAPRSAPSALDTAAFDSAAPAGSRPGAHHEDAMDAERTLQGFLRAIGEIARAELPAGACAPALDAATAALEVPRGWIQRIDAGGVPRIVHSRGASPASCAAAELGLPWAPAHATTPARGIVVVRVGAGAPGKLPEALRADGPGSAVFVPVVAGDPLFGALVLLTESPREWTAAELRVLADAGQVEQVIVNLALRARDTMPDGGALELSTIHVAAADGGQACAGIEAVNMGENLAAEALRRALDPFGSWGMAGRGSELSVAATLVRRRRTPGGRHRRRRRDARAGAVACHRRAGCVKRPARQPLRRAARRVDPGERVMAGGGELRRRCRSTCTCARRRESPRGTRRTSWSPARGPRGPRARA